MSEALQQQQRRRQRHGTFECGEIFGTALPPPPQPSSRHSAAACNFSHTESLMRARARAQYMQTSAVVCAGAFPSRAKAIDLPRIKYAIFSKGI